MSCGRQEAEIPLTPVRGFEVQLPPSQPPQDLPSELQWRVIKVKPSMPVPYILAGEPFGGYTHHPRRCTLPCYASLKGCSLSCPWCKFERRFTCYVPLIDPKLAKQQRVVVMGGKRTFKSAEGIKPGTVVGLARGNADRDTPLFAPAAMDTFNLLHHKKWQDKLPMDIRPYLFHLWQIRELSDHFGLRFFPSIRTQELENFQRAIEEDRTHKDAEPDV